MVPESLKDQGHALLTLKGITKNFEGLKAIDDVSLEVRRGEILGLIGPNGAGKTTLFNVITGFFPPSAGEIKFNGQEITGKKSFTICQMGICRTHQIMKPFRDMTVLQNVLVGAFFGRRNKSIHHRQAREEAMKWLVFAGLEKRSNAQPRSLTLVDLKRLEIARALATGPEILLLDECMSGLNPAETSQTMKFIRELRDRGITLFLIEHVMRVVMGLCDRIVVLHHGKKIAEGSPQEISSDDVVIKAYLGTRKV